MVSIGGSSSTWLLLLPLVDYTASTILIYDSTVLYYNYRLVIYDRK